MTKFSAAASECDLAAISVAIARANFDAQVVADLPGPVSERPRVWVTLESLSKDARDGYISEARAYLGHLARAGFAVVAADELERLRAAEATDRQRRIDFAFARLAAVQSAVDEAEAEADRTE